MSDTPVKVEWLRAVCDAHGKDVLVLIALDRETNGMQLATWGRSAADKVEAHQIKEWIRQSCQDGGPPKTREVHESFILDAALNRERLDRCIDALEQLRDEYIEDALAGEFTRCGCGPDEKCGLCVAQEAIAFAKDGPAGAEEGG